MENATTEVSRPTLRQALRPNSEPDRFTCSVSFIPRECPNYQQPNGRHWRKLGLKTPRRCLSARGEQTCMNSVLPSVPQNSAQQSAHRVSSELTVCPHPPKQPMGELDRKLTRDYVFGKLDPASVKCVRTGCGQKRMRATVIVSPRGPRRNSLWPHIQAASALRRLLRPCFVLRRRLIAATGNSISTPPVCRRNSLSPVPVGVTAPPPLSTKSFSPLPLPFFPDGARPRVPPSLISRSSRLLAKSWSPMTLFIRMLPYCKRTALRAASELERISGTEPTPSPRSAFSPLPTNSVA